jgi:hypothetical protein
MHAAHIRAEAETGRKSLTFPVVTVYRLSVHQFKVYVDASDSCACRVIVASRVLEPYVSLSPTIFPNQEQ